MTFRATVFNLTLLTSIVNGQQPPPYCADSTLQFKIQDTKGYCNSDLYCTVDEYSSHCKTTCEANDCCVDSSAKFRYVDEGDTKWVTCNWVSNDSSYRCDVNGVSNTCPVTCGLCDPNNSPTESPTLNLSDLVSELIQRIDTMEDELHALEGIVDALEGDIDALESENEYFSTVISDLQNEVFPPTTSPRPSTSSAPSPTPSRTRTWLQHGDSITGENECDHSGLSVSLSNNGSTVAIGAIYNDDNGSNSGHCRIFSYDDDELEWVQKGGDIDGENSVDFSGYRVSIADDGDIVAVSATNNAGNGESSGHVRVHRYDDVSDEWLQIGSDIDGQAAGDRLGTSVALSNDGKTIVIGAPNNDSNGSNSGHTLIFEYDDDTCDWVLLGSEIEGENTDDKSGWSVSMAKNGDVVAIGAYYNDDNGSNSGKVSVYSYSENEEDWQPIGTDINGDADEYSGYSVALSEDGEVVAIGDNNPFSNGDRGRTRIYAYDNDVSDWVQMSDAIYGEAAYDESGADVSLSNDGKIVAIGAIGNDGNGWYSGHVRVYGYDGSEWLLLGDDIDGENGYDYFGTSVSLSGDGLTVAIGADGNSNGGYYTGHVKVYKYAVE